MNTTIIIIIGSIVVVVGIVYLMYGLCRVSALSSTYRMIGKDNHNDKGGKA